MSTMSQFFASNVASLSIKSIQRGVIDLNSSGVATGTASITTVVPSKTELRFLGYVSDGNQATIVLTNSTTITATRKSTSTQILVSWELTEFN